MIQELTDKEIERQDYVDNRVYELLNDLLPAGNKLNWDIEIIGAIRDAVQVQITDRKLMNEAAFYPYLKNND